jgi:hypothetical protein
MNYPEELRERWNECMYDERDIIQRFLEKQYDIRYGRQRDTWHFEPAVELVAYQGSHVLLHDIKLDKDKFVVFYVEAFCDKNAEWECSDFAYGELSKVIEALPNAEDIVWDKAVNDLKVMTTNLRIDYLLADAPFKYEVGSKHYVVDDVKCVNGMLSLVQALGNDTPVSDLPLEVLVNLRDHINIEVLHHSNEYKELMELLSLQENMRFECQNYGDATFVIDGTDVTFDISSVRRDDKGNLVIYGNDIDADVCDNIELTEKDIKHEYLVGIINEIKRGKYYDIMDTYNGHNPELVRKINKAWRDDKYHNLFGDILFALGCRDAIEIQEKYDIKIDRNETAMDNAHKILEGVCDDWDLECVLAFIRFKED